MSDYIITTNGELYHYRVPGMRWGHRKASYDSGSYRRNENWNQKSSSYRRNSIDRGINPNLGRMKPNYRTGETTIGSNIKKHVQKSIDNRNTKTGKINKQKVKNAGKKVKNTSSKVANRIKKISSKKISELDKRRNDKIEKRVEEIMLPGKKYRNDNWNEKPTYRNPWDEKPTYRKKGNI